MSHQKARPVRHDDPGMRGQRSRDVTTGELRQKRADTTVGALEKLYGVDLHRRSDMTLGALRKELGRITARSKRRSRRT